MADERTVDEIITTFFLSTCLVRPSTPNRHAVLAPVCGAYMVANSSLKDNREAECFPQTTGSVAEFYIEPMLPCFGDIDVMFYFNAMLAIPVGQQPPEYLPDEFLSRVEVVEIIDSHLPGYVYLWLKCFLTKCSDDGKYSAAKNNSLHTQRQGFIINFEQYYNEYEVHGPALLQKIKGMRSSLSVDLVRCVRCLSWPPHANDWPTRQRNYGWPDSATVDRVVSIGCDVVAVAHRQCKQDEKMGIHQWRLSFSRAEVVLINSWTPVQQIVYHMLRVFVKTECNEEHLTDSSNKSGPQILSNYHIKTLMLWACEQMPSYWWTDDVNLVKICLKLLHILAGQVNDVQNPHYFIESCNLVDSSFDTETIASRLMSLCLSCLSEWFLKKYIRKCSQLCSSNVPLLLNDASTVQKLHTAVSVIVNRRLDTVLCDLSITFLAAELNISHNLSILLTSERSCAYALSELGKINTPLSFFFTGVAFLHIAEEISRNNFEYKLMDVLATMVSKATNIGIRHCSEQTSSVLMLTKATKLMSDVANKSLGSFEMIMIELSKAYLCRVLRCTDAHCDFTQCLANIYLAVLEYTIGNYQTAINHTTMVTESENMLQWQCSSHVVQGKLLPKIDDNIDNVLGLSVYYHYLRTAALNQQQDTHVSVFMTKLFAHYLKIKCLLADKFQHSVNMSSAYEILRYRKSVIEMQNLTTCDVLIVKLQVFDKSEQNKYRKSVISETVPDTSDLVELLQQSAVEHLTTYRQLEVRDLGSVVTIITSDFEAMYAYKRGNYQQCLQLCTQNFHALLHAVYDTDVSIFPGFVQWLDDDIISLISLTQVINLQRNCKVPFFCINQLTLLLYLMTQCQLKLRHLMTSLVQTLIGIKVARRKYPDEWTHDHLTLKLTERKVLQYVE